jgi:hypothetical protein
MKDLVLEKRVRITIGVKRRDDTGGEFIYITGSVCLNVGYF